MRVGSVDVTCGAADYSQSPVMCGTGFHYLLRFLVVVAIVPSGQSSRSIDRDYADTNGIPKYNTIKAESFSHLELRQHAARQA